LIVCTGVDDLGGEDAGVFVDTGLVINSKNLSNCFKDRALCKVSNGLMGGNPPNPSNTQEKKKTFNYQ
jgi:hypothetical protein